MSASKSQPSKYLVKLAQKLFSEEGPRQKFIDSIIHGVSSPQALLWMRSHKESPFEELPRLVGQPPFVSRLAPKQSPGRNSLHEEGAYYICDYQSILMFSPALALKNVSSVLDLCAAPGGKSALSFLTFHPQVLISNETVTKRCSTLISNLKRCQIPAQVINKDPTPLAEIVPDSFDLVVVDAPCSGQSLLAKGETAPGAFHPNNVNGCRLRQRRILSEGGKMAKPGGYVLYSTCTYSLEENEEIVEWFVKKNPEFLPVEIDSLKTFQSKHSELPCYRFYPDPETGAGGFSVLFKKNGEADSSLPHIPQEMILWPKPI